MGFFDFVKPLLGVAATVVGGTVAGAAVADILGIGDDEEMVTKVGTGAQLAALRGTDPVLGRNVAQSLAAIGAAPGGMVTGGLRKRTIVETVNAAGQVVKRKVTKGGVAVFQQDVTAANRVARQLRKLDKRMPKKIVKQSETARLTEEVKNAALRHARDSADHNGHHGHHGNGS